MKKLVLTVLLYLWNSALVYGQGPGWRDVGEYYDDGGSEPKDGMLIILATILIFVVPYFLAQKESADSEDLDSFAVKYWKWWFILGLSSIFVGSDTKSVGDGILTLGVIGALGYVWASGKR